MAGEIDDVALGNIATDEDGEYYVTGAGAGSQTLANTVVNIDLDSFDGIKQWLNACGDELRRVANNMAEVWEDVSGEAGGGNSFGALDVADDLRNRHNGLGGLSNRYVSPAESGGTTNVLWQLAQVCDDAADGIGRIQDNYAGTEAANVMSEAEFDDLFWPDEEEHAAGQSYGTIGDPNGGTSDVGGTGQQQPGYGQQQYQ